MAKILYLYYDIMNLYGENGNIRMIEQVLKNRGVEVVCDRKTITDTDIDFTQYDFIYCGAGTELSRDACLKHLKQFGESLKSAFENDTVMLFTGNSYEMLGKSIHTASDEDVEGLNIFDFTVEEQKKNRYSGDVKLTSKLCDKTFIGYINKCSKVEGIENPLFKVEVMAGSLHCTEDGIRERNFFGTQVTGPIMVKNPDFAEYIASLVLA
ncbi:MAG: hypothetical protein E7566_02355 [Ruminococcaceae bacterium]|nr:hypothetical protein [Oscillospiraceae bacterium]